MARYRGFDGFGRFPPSVPRKAEGGIKAHSKRGAFASSWWGRRWIEVLEGFGLAARLRRGRSYARKGQVLTLEVEAGSVTATVQGSRARPYRVELHLQLVSDAAWEDLALRLAADVRMGARLLAGEIPPEVEELAHDAGVRLFPDRLRDLETDCSCPDWSNPCKHIAAVHYLLAEELDRDPFLLFRLRGMERERFTRALVAAGGVVDVDAKEVEEVGEVDGEVVDEAPSRIVRGEDDPGATPTGGGVRPGVGEGSGEAVAWSVDPDVFWGRGAPVADEAGPEPEATAAPDREPDGRAPDGSADGLPPLPRIHAALVRRLGAFPFWRGERPFLDEMAGIYREASVQARELLGDDRA